MDISHDLVAGITTALGRLDPYATLPVGLGAGIPNQESRFTWVSLS